MGTPVFSDGSGGEFNGLETTVNTKITEFSGAADTWGNTAEAVLDAPPDGISADTANADVAKTTPPKTDSTPTPTLPDISVPGTLAESVKLDEYALTLPTEFVPVGKPSFGGEYTYKPVIEEPDNTAPTPPSMEDTLSAPPTTTTFPAVERPSSLTFNTQRADEVHLSYGLGSYDTYPLNGLTRPTWKDEYGYPGLPEGPDVPSPAYEASFDSLSGFFSLLMPTGGDPAEGIFPALPDWVWSTTWSRLAGDLSRQAVAQRREAARAHAKLGWAMPGGVMLARQDAANQEINDKIAQAAYEQARQQAQQGWEAFWKGMQELRETEKIYYEYRNSYAERQVKHIGMAMEHIIGAYNAAVNEFAAYSQMVNAENQRVEAETNAKRLQIEEFNANVDAKAKIDVAYDKLVNEQYALDWKEAELNAQNYASWVKSLDAFVDGQRNKVLIFGEQVKAYESSVRAWLGEWEAFSHRATAAELPIKARQVEAIEKGHEVSWMGQLVQQETARFGAAVDAKKLELSSKQTAAEILKAKLDVLSQQFSSLASLYGQLFSANAQAKTTDTQVAASFYNADIQKFQVDAQLAIANAGRSLEAAKANLQAYVEWQRSASTTYGHIAGAAYAAAQVSFSATSGETFSHGYDTRYAVSYDGGELSRLPP